MRQEYVISRIKQIGREISIVDTNQISYQHSANLYIEVELDASNASPFKDMLLSAVARINNTSRTEYCPIIKEDNKNYIMLTEKTLAEDGTIYLSIGGINKDKVVVTSNLVALEIAESNPIIATVTPNEMYWQIEVRNAMEYWYNTIIKPDLEQKQQTIKELIVEAQEQQDISNKLQEDTDVTITNANNSVVNMQKSIDTIIANVEKKMNDGEFMPEHKWEGSVLFFKNSNGTWDEGFEVPGMDTFNWKVANCVEEATYQANIENWGTVENSLLAITFNGAMDASKAVLLKINEEEIHPILSGRDAMLGEELENKSTILRFDGTSWLVQTSQSGTVQSSDKSVKDIVTVTRKELKQLQASGQLVDGTLYQTVENPIDVTPLENEILELDERTTIAEEKIEVLESTTIKITDIESDDGYTKFPDGTLICRGNISVKCSVNIAWASEFYCEINNVATFPVPFIDIPNCNVIAQNGVYSVAVDNTVVSNTKITKMTLVRPENTDERPYMFSYIAIGRWK